MIVTQTWTHDLRLMQQTVLLTAIRGPDGVAKYHPSKYLVRWYRRCVLLGALDQNIFTRPDEPGGGSFTGPSFSADDVGNYSDWRIGMADRVDAYLRSLDEVQHHFQLHFLHGTEILGYKHPDPFIRAWWLWLYHTLVADMHLAPETEKQLDFRLGDDEGQWREISSRATQD